MPRINILFNGYKGKMGQVFIPLTRTAENINRFSVIATTDFGDNVPNMIHGCDVVVDFSVHTATLPLLADCKLYGKKPVVIGTTGHSPADQQLIASYGDSIPIVMASNFSVGMNTLFWLTRKAVEILGPDFDLEVVEMHHRMKKDAPSGSAKTLAGILREVRENQLDVDRGSLKLRHGREGMVGGRIQNEIGIHAIRGGDVVGDHTVIFAGLGERVELTHKASSRETFARGALRAVEWIVGKPPGLYDMMDVLGLNEKNRVELVT